MLKPGTPATDAEVDDGTLNASTLAGNLFISACVCGRGGRGGFLHSLGMTSMDSVMCIQYSVTCDIILSLKYF